MAVEMNADGFLEGGEEEWREAEEVLYEVLATEFRDVFTGPIHTYAVRGGALFSFFTDNYRLAEIFIKNSMRQHERRGGRDVVATFVERRVIGRKVIGMFEDGVRGPRQTHFTLELLWAV